jgi:integrase
MDTRNLILRHRTWFVRVAVPKALRPIVGAREIVRSLKTRDLREAARKKHAVLAQIADALTHAERGKALEPASPEYLLQVAKDTRAALRAGEMSEQDAAANIDHATEAHLRAAARKYGQDARTGDPLLSSTQERAVLQANRIVSDGDFHLLADLLDSYLKEIEKHVVRSTYREKKRELAEFLNWAGIGSDVSSVTRRMAARYVSEHLLAKSLAPATVKDTIMHLHAFWSWMEDRALLAENTVNPWTRLSRSVKESTRGKASRRPWTDAELQSLIAGCDKGDPLLAMILIAAFTGMRREEIASLRVTDVTGESISIREGKTSAAVRPVPIHPKLAPLITRLRDTSKDKFLIPGLLTGGEDAKRGHLIGKRFGTLRDKLKFDKALDFHGLRRAFITRMEGAGVPVSTVKLVVGHARSDITFGLYSGGLPLKALADAVEKVSYGPVDDLASTLGADFSVTKRAHRRPHPKA